MTRGRDGRVKVELQFVRDASVDTERVVGFAVEVLAQFGPDEEGDDERDQEGEEAASGRLLFVCRVGLRARAIPVRGWGREPSGS